MSPHGLIRTSLSTFALISVVIGQVPGAASQDLLTNPGFEAPGVPLVVDSFCPAISGSIATSWIDNSCWGGNETASVTYAASPLGAHGGGLCQWVSLGSGIVQLIQPVPLQAGKLYTASIWMRAPAPLRVTLALRKAGVPYTFYVVRTVLLTSTWTLYTASGVCPTTDGFFMIRAEEPGLFLVDDASLTSQDRVLDFQTAAIPETNFGMHFHWPDVPWSGTTGISSVRIWDADGPQGIGSAQWAGVHLGPNLFDWQALDAHVQSAASHGAEIQYLLGRTPPWASARPNEPSPYGPGQAAEPANLQVWRDWVTAVATRYRGQIRLWEIWNEPNDAQFFTGTPQVLVTLAQEAYAILKAIDPANRVVSPSPYALDYLDEYLTLGGGAFADIIGYHFYILGDAPEYLYDSYIPNAKLILENHGIQSKPLWNTEAGWFAPPNLGDEVGAGYVSRSYILNWAAGCERFYYYEWDNRGTPGISLTVPPACTVPTAAGVAYQETARWLAGARIVDFEIDANNNWILEIRRPDNRSAHILWNPDSTSEAPFSYNVPSGWQITWQRDLAGNNSPWVGSVLPVEGRPVLLDTANPVGVPEVHSAAEILPLRITSPARGAIQYVLESEGGIYDFRLVDVAGRQVVNLGSKQLQVGTIRDVLPTHNAIGRDLASGMYFLHVGHGDRSFQAPFVLLR